MKSMYRVAILAAAVAAIAQADITNQTITFQSGSALNLDNGTVSSSGGDLLFNGSSLAFQGVAGGYILGIQGANGYNNIVTLGFLKAALANKAFSPNPIAGSLLAVDLVSGVHTNGNNLAKIWILAVSSVSITVEFTTFGGTALPPPPVPTITGVFNNSSLIPPGFSNSGIAPSTLFVIQGSDLAAPGSIPVLQDLIKGLPTTLNQTSLSVAAGGKNYTPAIYYSSPAQVAAVLPAAVPAGPATLTVTNGGASSSAFNITVVASAYGIDAINGNVAVMTDAVSGSLITPASSGKPGEIVVLWGTGLGSDSADSDTTYISAPHPIGTPVAVYVGGVQTTNVAYSGASVYPGVHVIGFTIPEGVPNGCFVPIIVVTGSGANAVVSNTPTAAIMKNGGVCSDPQYGASGAQIAAFNGQSTVNVGGITVTHSTAPGTVGGPETITNLANATFQQLSGATYGAAALTVGTCTLNQQPVSNGANIVNLDPGAMTVTPPGSSTAIVMGTVPGFVFANLPSGSLDLGGTLTFQANGGTKPPVVGRFSSTLNFPAYINWTNQNAAGTVTRAAGLTYTWSGGTPGSFVTMSGHSTSPSSAGGGGAAAIYTCIAPLSAGQFTVPAYILAALPAGIGESTIGTMTAESPFSAAGLDYAFTLGVMEISIASVYQ